MSFKPVNVGNPELNRAINTILARADESPPHWWWMSFCDGDDGHFLGVAIVSASNYGTAMGEAWKHGCNPGGSVAATEIPDVAVPPDEWLNRLLRRDEIAALGKVMEERMSRVAHEVIDNLNTPCPLCGESISPESTELHIMASHPEHYEKAMRGVEELATLPLAEMLAGAVEAGIIDAAGAAAIAVKAGQAGFGPNDSLREVERRMGGEC